MLQTLTDNSVASLESEGSAIMNQLNDLRVKTDTSSTSLLIDLLKANSEEDYEKLALQAKSLVKNVEQEITSKSSEWQLAVDSQLDDLEVSIKSAKEGLDAVW